MKIISAVFIGGAVGTVLRYLVNITTLQLYPMGTLIVNILGSFLLGLFTFWLFKRIKKKWLQAGLGVGLCGGFTTMSTLAADTLFLFQEIAPTQAIFYIVCSLFGGIFAALIGYVLGVKLSSVESRQEGGV